MGRTLGGGGRRGYSAATWGGSTTRWRGNTCLREVKIHLDRHHMTVLGEFWEEEASLSDQIVRPLFRSIAANAYIEDLVVYCVDFSGELGREIFADFARSNVNLATIFMRDCVLGSFGYNGLSELIRNPRSQLWNVHFGCHDNLDDDDDSCLEILANALRGNAKLTYFGINPSQGGDLDLLIEPVENMLINSTAWGVQLHEQQ